MTIDLSTLKPGDKVKLRCGGEIEWRDIENWWGSMWRRDGNISGPDFNNPLDIIAIERKPEPRKVVEYVPFYWHHIAYLSHTKLEHPHADKYYRITIVEGEPPVIEEVE